MKKKTWLKKEMSLRIKFLHPKKFISTSFFSQEVMQNIKIHSELPIFIMKKGVDRNLLRYKKKFPTLRMISLVLQSILIINKIDKEFSPIT